MIEDELAAAAEADAAEMREAAAPSKGEEVAALVRTALALQDEIEELELTLKTAKAELEDVKRRRIPAVLDEIGVPELTVDTGNRQVRVTIGHKAFGSLTYATDQDLAVGLLEAAGFDGGVLTTASVDLRSDEVHMLDEIAKLFEERYGKSVNLKRDVHHSTLRAFVLRVLEEHPEFDAKKVGVTVVREAKLTAR